MMSPGSVVIPAHNESRVIGRLLVALVDGLAEGTDIVVACNGCTDDTAAVAQRFCDVVSLRVLDLPEPSKIGALNAADEIAPTFPRAYVDADVLVSGRSVAEVFDVLRTASHVSIARPPLVYDTRGASRPVQAFFRARSRTSSLMTAMWGAGFFAVSASGRERWGSFPKGADDYFVNSLFAPEETRIVDTEPVVVTPPRTTAALLRTLRRVYAVQPTTQAVAKPPSSVGTMLDLFRATRGRPLWVVDASIYAALALAARLLMVVRRAGDAGWARDDTTR